MRTAAWGGGKRSVTCCVAEHSNFLARAFARLFSASLGHYAADFSRLRSDLRSGGNRGSSDARAFRFKMVCSAASRRKGTDDEGCRARTRRGPGCPQGLGIEEPEAVLRTTADQKAGRPEKAISSSPRLSAAMTLRRSSWPSSGAMRWSCSKRR